MNNYIVVQDWMLDLGLPASEINALALIWGFTQDGQHACHASLQYIGRFCAIKEKASVSRMLKRMAEKGIITIDHTGGGVSEYKVSEVLSKSQQGCCRNNNGVLSKQQRGVVVTTTDNNIYNIINNNNPPISPQREEVANVDSDSDGAVLFDPETGEKPTSSSPKKKNRNIKARPAGFRPPTKKEVLEYFTEHFPENPALCMEFFDYYNSEENGWRVKDRRSGLLVPMSNWKNTAQTWIRKRRQDNED